MKRLIAAGMCAAMLVAGVGAHAAEGADVTYLGGTTAGIKEGSAGKLDMTVANELKFHTGAVELGVPYEQMTRVEYREQNRFRLGVAGSILVGMLKAREKVHTVTITWADDKETAHVATLEMPQERARALLDVLKAKTHAVPTVCEEKFNQSCTLPR